MDKIRLGYLTSQYPALSQTFVLQEVLELRKRGFEIGVASINSPTPGDDKPSEDEQAEIESTCYVKEKGASGAVSACCRAFLRSPLTFFSALYYALRLAGTDLRGVLFNLFYFVEAAIVGEWLRRNGSRHLHVHFGSQAGTVGLFVRQLFSDVSLSYTFHGSDVFYDVKRFFLKEKIKAAELIVCVSSYTRSQLMRISDPGNWSKLRVVRLGVDLKRFSPLERQRTGGEFRLLCVGRLVRTKGQFVLVEAVAALREKGYDVVLDLVGDGPDMNGLRSAVEELEITDAVRFAGAVNNDRMTDHYSEADAFVLASFAEGLPVVLMEAMACGLPVVSTSINGIPELIANGENGILVPAGDREALANAIESIIANEEFRVEMGTNARRAVAADFDIEKNVDHLSDLFSSALSASDSRGERIDAAGEAPAMIKSREGKTSGGQK